MRWRPRRWRPWLLGAAALLLVVRAALPAVIRWQLETRGSAALVDSRLTVGDVDLRLWKGEVTLEDVALDLPPPPGATTPQRPFVAWRRLVVGLRWWPLVHRRVQLWLLELDGPKVALARRLDGTLQLPVPVPSPEPPSPEPPPEPSGWSFGVDQIVLKHGGVQFADATLGADEDPIEVNLDNVQVRDLAFTPDVYGGPSRLALDLRIDRGRIRLDAWGGLTPDGPKVRALLRAVRLPVQRTRRYVPGVGWSGLWGDVGLGVSYVHVPGGRDEVRGVALARNVTVWVEKIEEPALAWKQLAVRLDRVDVREQLAAVREVVLDGASVVVQPRAQPPLPVMVLAAAEAAPPTPPPAPAPEAAPPTPPAPDAAAPPDAAATTTTVPATTTTTVATPQAGAAAAPAKPAEPATPWRWRVEQVRLPDATVKVRGPFDPLDVGLNLVLSKVAGPEATQAGVDLGLRVRDASVAAQGTLHLPKPGWDGTLKVDGLVLPPLLAVAGGPAATMLGDGRLGLDLAIAAVPPATDVSVRGGVTLDGLAVNAGDGIPAVTLETFALRDADVLVPGALAGAPSGTARVRLGELALGGAKATAPDGKAWFAGLGTASLRGADVSVPLPSDAGGPTTVRFAGLELADVWATGDDPKVFGAAVGRTTVRDTDVALAPGGGPRVHVGGVQLEAPFVRLTRTESGMALPGATPAPAAAPAETAPAATPAAAPPAAGAPLQLALDDLRIAHGSVGFTDRTVKPFYAGWIDPLTVDVDRLRMPGPEIARLKVHAGTPRGGTIDVDGNMGRRGSQVDLTVRDLALAPFNPYATAYSNYSISRGALNVTTRGKFEGPAYDTDTNILLSDFDLASRGGDTLFTEQLGVPLTVALALMRDVQGDIVLDVPVAGDEKGTSVAIGSIALGALRRALVNALASPLKLAGMLVPGGSERLDGLVPKPVPFLVGRATVAPGAEEQLSQLAALLASRPAMAVALTAAPTDADVRWMAEQDLRAELEKPRGVLAAIGGLSERGTRNRILAALQARANGQAGDLDAEDAATLDRWLAERGPLPPERVQALATDRVAAVEKILEDQYGVAGDRVTRGENPTAPGDAPTVVLGLGAVAR